MQTDVAEPMIVCQFFLQLVERVKAAGGNDFRLIPPCCCVRSCNEESMAKPEATKVKCASDKIPGSGCPKCNQMEATM